jgi:hypothetical protein
VSHYEGTANIQTLKDSGIDLIFTTNSKPFVDVNDSLVVKSIKAFM